MDVEQVEVQTQTANMRYRNIMAGKAPRQPAGKDEHGFLTAVWTPSNALHSRSADIPGVASESQEGEKIKRSMTIVDLDKNIPSRSIQ